MNMLQMTRGVLLRPYDFYYDIQDEANAKLMQAVYMIVLTIIVKILSLYWISYIFQSKEDFEISIVYEAGYILVPWLTWSLANWGVSAIMDGEGKFKEILVGSAYAFAPYAVITLPLALFTNLLSLQEKPLYTLIVWVSYIWVVILFLMQVKILHDFDFSKTLFISFLSIIGMLLIWFISLLMFGLINQAIVFVINLYKEINYRI